MQLIQIGCPDETRLEIKEDAIELLWKDRHSYYFSMKRANNTHTIITAFVNYYNNSPGDLLRTFLPLDASDYQINSSRLRLLIIDFSNRICKIKAVAHLETPRPEDIDFPEKPLKFPFRGFIKGEYDQELNHAIEYGQRWVVTPYYLDYNHPSVFQPLCRPFYIHIRKPEANLERIIEELIVLSEVILQYDGTVFNINNLSDRFFMGLRGGYRAFLNSIPQGEMNDLDAEIRQARGDFMGALNDPQPNRFEIQDSIRTAKKVILDTLKEFRKHSTDNNLPSGLSVIEQKIEELNPDRLFRNPTY